MKQGRHAVNNDNSNPQSGGTYGSARETVNNGDTDYTTRDHLSFDEIIGDTRDSVVGDETEFILRRMRRKQIMVWALTIVGFLALAALIVWGFMVYQHTFSNDAVPAPSPTNSATASAHTSIKSVAELYPHAPAVREGSEIAQVKGHGSDARIIAGGWQLSIVGATISAAQEQCEVVRTTDFCLAATASLPQASQGTSASPQPSPSSSSSESSQPQVSIYRLKDAVHSRLFDNPTSVDKVTVKGSQAAAIVTLPSGKSTIRAIVIITKDSSGFMIMVSPDADGHSTANLAKNVSIAR